MRRFFSMNVNEMGTTSCGGSAKARARTSGLRRCRGEAAPKVSGIAARFVVGFIGLLVLVAIAALAPIEGVKGGAGAVGTSEFLASVAGTFVQNDWLLRSFGIALCVAVAGSLLTASKREWQELAEHECGGRIVLGALLPESRRAAVCAQRATPQHLRSEPAHATSSAGARESLRDLEQRLRALRATNAELLGRHAGLGIGGLSGSVSM